MSVHINTDPGICLSIYLGIYLSSVMNRHLAGVA